MKSLKDIEIWRNQVSIDDLRDVAREVIKKLESQRDGLYDDDYEGFHLMTGKIWGLREFFNLENE